MQGSKSVKCVARRFGIVLVLGLILAATVNAYTVVMRGGRRVEVPTQFVLTAATLTYEVSPGVQVTLLTAAIDIAATEKANNQAAGTFMKRVQSALPQSPVTQMSSSTPRPTITNRDLESSVRRRNDSVVAYEDRRKELGLPSVEESRRQAAAEADAIRVELQQQRAAVQESESYWRERAAALRTEIAALDAQLAYVRSRLDEHPWGNEWSGGWSNLFVSTGGVSFGSFGRGGGFGRGVVLVTDRLATPADFTVGSIIDRVLLWRRTARGLEPALRSAAARFAAGCLLIREVFDRPEVISRGRLDPAVLSSPVGGSRMITRMNATS